MIGGVERTERGEGPSVLLMVRPRPSRGVRVPDIEQIFPIGGELCFMQTTAFKRALGPTAATSRHFFQIIAQSLGSSCTSTRVVLGILRARILRSDTTIDIIPRNTHQVAILSNWTANLTTQSLIILAFLGVVPQAHPEQTSMAGRSLVET